MSVSAVYQTPPHRGRPFAAETPPEQIESAACTIHGDATGTERAYAASLAPDGRRDALIDAAIVVAEERGQFEIAALLREARRLDAQQAEALAPIPEHQASIKAEVRVIGRTVETIERGRKALKGSRR